MCCLFIISLACSLFTLHSSESIVQIYDEQSQALSINPKIYNHIEQTLPIMPTHLCYVIASFLELDWHASKYMECPTKLNGYLRIAYVDYPLQTALNLDDDAIQKYIAAGTINGNIHIWNSAKHHHKYIQKLKGHASSVAALHYHDTTLASASSDSVRIWPHCSQEKSYKLKQAKNVTTLAFLHNTKIVTGRPDSFLQVWDLETQTPTNTRYKNHTLVANIHDTTFISMPVVQSATGKYLTLHRKSDYIASNIIMLDEPHESGVKAIAIDQDLFAATDGYYVKIFDVRNTKTHVHKLAHTAAVTLLARCGKDRFASSARAEGTIKLWNTKNIIQSSESALKHPTHVFSLPSTNGIALAANSQGNSLTVAVESDPDFMQTWSITT